MAEEEARPESRRWRAAKRAKHREENPFVFQPESLATGSLLTFHEQPWRHFWLPYLEDKREPRLKRDELPSSLTEDPDSDSEDDAPRRDRLVCRAPISQSVLDSDPQPVFDPDPQPDPHVISQHVLAERHTTHEVAPHSCDYCGAIVLDLRKQTAQVAVGPGVASWITVGPGQEIGYTFAQAEAAATARAGCLFFSQLVHYAYLGFSHRVQFAHENHQPDPFGTLGPALVHQEHRIHVNFTVQNNAEVTFSLFPKTPENRSSREYISRERLFLREFSIYAVPGIPPLNNFLGLTLPPNLVPNSALSVGSLVWMNVAIVTCRDTEVSIRMVGTLDRMIGALGRMIVIQAAPLSGTRTP